MTRIIGTWLFMASMVWGQTAFTVASIKPNRSSDERFLLRFQPGGGLTATGVTLKMLIMNAYELAGYQVMGAPAWVGTERWDIEAKTDSVRGMPKREELDAMLQRLLEERFDLKSHRQSKKLPAYVLVMAKGGAKLKVHPPADGARPQERFGFGTAAGIGVAIPELVRQLSLGLGRPVLDHTGLEGRYDFTLEWTPAPGEFTAAAIGLPPRAEPPPPADPNRPSIFTALGRAARAAIESDEGPRRNPDHRSRGTAVGKLGLAAANRA